MNMSSEIFTDLTSIASWKMSSDYEVYPLSSVSHTQSIPGMACRVC